MQTWIVTVSVLGAICLGGAASGATPLFTAQDVAAWNARKPELKGRGIEAPGPNCHALPKADAPAAPTINIFSPILKKPLVAPIDINVKFVPTGGDVIQPSTFKVCY